MEKSILEIQAANDLLVETVNDQISFGTFDDSNSQILEQLVEGLGDPRGLVRLRFAETLGE
ncbi:MAG: HEAT repeat domain-containing protein, partial [Pseudanabaena sp.]